jgi:hypothetical protein
VVKKLIEMQTGQAGDVHFPSAEDSLDYPLIVNA